MLDVSQESLADLIAPAVDDALARSLRRLADDGRGPSEPIAGFNSAL